MSQNTGILNKTDSEHLYIQYSVKLGLTMPAFLFYFSFFFLGSAN